jgi:uncharacterized protein
MVAMDLYVSWDEYHQQIEELAKLINSADLQFSSIVCIARGGLRVGDILSRMFDLPLGIIAAKSYTGMGDRSRGNLSIAAQLSIVDRHLGSSVLLVDDLVDSGATLSAIVDWLYDHYPEVTEIKTAVLWYKASSIYQPDYFVSYLAENPWIHQPFEKYDRQSSNS